MLVWGPNLGRLNNYQYYHWLITDNDCSHTELVEHYDIFAPAEHQVQIEGADLSGDQLLVGPGHVLTVQFVPLTPASEHLEQDSDHSDPPPPDHAHSSTSDTKCPSGKSIGPPGGDDRKDSDTSGPDRSRSPRRCSSASGCHTAFVSGVFSGGVLGSLLSDVEVHTLRAASSWMHTSRLGLEADPIQRLQAQEHRDEARDGPPQPDPPDFQEPAPDHFVDEWLPRQAFEAIFWLFVPEFATEVLTVSLGAPTSVQEALAAVAEARMPRDRRRFPILVPVFPQTFAGVATVLALPRWPVEGCLVLIDRQHYNGKACAIFLQSTVSRTDILRSAGISDGADIVVYVRDLPWAIAGPMRITVAHGDLIVIASVNHPVLVSASLDDMLLSEHGWAAESPSASLSRHPDVRHL